MTITTNLLTSSSFRIMKGIVSEVTLFALLFARDLALCISPWLCYFAAHGGRKGYQAIISQTATSSSDLWGKSDDMNHEQVRTTLTGSLESVVAAQMQEMEMVRQKVFSLEQAQLNMKQRYRIGYYVDIRR